jgi:hypothetical protein
VLSVLFLKGPYLTFFDNSGSHLELMMTGLYRLSTSGESEKLGGTLEIFVLVILIPIISLLTIFLFKKRNIQIIFTRILILLILIFILSSFGRSAVIFLRFDATLISWYKIAFPFLQLLLSVLAYKGIKKDDELVKSYDRLR